MVLAKQVPDPETPPSQFKIDESTNSVVPPNGVPPVVNGFDLNAVEAALLLRDAGADVEITVGRENHAVGTPVHEVLSGLLVGQGDARAATKRDAFSQEHNAPQGSKPHA